jgi:Do/DeqQ family serine protease
MKAKRFLGMLAITVLGAFIAVLMYAKLFKTNTTVVEVPVESKIQYVNMPVAGDGAAMDFTQAVEQSIDAVVHVKTKEFREYVENPLYEFFFGDQPNREAQPILGFGSGVIISGKGYIVTANHVIEDSDEVLVVLNDKREFTASLIGTDPTTDIALLKVEAGELTALKFGNSDALKLGEWVLAIGNPYNLTSTVTAGIVSAKARGGVMRRQAYGIESFIQTDAAVNPGNSGGALINTRGELVGINTLIASSTGAFSGYSFAVPVSIVEKVVTDLIEFGEVQRAILGINIATVTAELAKEMKIDKIEGVYVSNVLSEGAARQAGIREGDVIISINDTRVNSNAELQETVSKYRPGQEVKVLIKRDGKLKQFDVVLRNLEGSTEIEKKSDVIELLGASFEPISDREKQALGIRKGVKVKSVKPGKFMKVGIEEGFVLTSVNKMPVGSVKDITDILENTEGAIIIEGVDQKGSKIYYAFGM